ncbi:MAG: hypothetical protein ACRDPE_17855 [Solirubrobacterales bacterium]
MVGWITYRTLRRKAGASKISDLASVIAAIGGAAVTKAFDNPNLFGWYCVGLAIGFFGYFLLAVRLEEARTVDGKPDPVTVWMGED